MKKYRLAQLLGLVFMALSLAAALGQPFTPGSIRAATPTPDIPVILNQLNLGVPAGNGHQPQHLALDSRRQHLYTLNSGLPEIDEGNTISVVNLTTNQVTNLLRLNNALPPDAPAFSSLVPLNLQVDPYRPRLYALWGDLYANPPYSNLTIIDTDTLTVLKTLPGIRAIAPGPNHLYLADHARLWTAAPNSLTELKSITLKSPISNLQSPLLLNSTANRLYLAQDQNTLTAFVADSLAPVGSYTAPSQLIQAAVDETARRVLVIDHDGTQVYLRALTADGQALTTPAPFILNDDTYSDPHLALTGSTVYVTNRTIDAYLLQTFNVAGLNLVNSQTIPGYPTDLAAGSAAGLAYLSYASSANYLLTIDPAAGRAQVIFTALSLLDTLADPAQNQLYALTNDGMLHVFNLTTYAPLTRLSTQVFNLSPANIQIPNPQPSAYYLDSYLSLDSNRQRLYLSGDTPRVIDTAQLTVTATLSTPGQLTADPASNQLFLTPPCHCRFETCNTFLLNADTLTTTVGGSATLFPPQQDPMVAPCVMSTQLDVKNRLLYTRINNGVAGSNSGAYFTVFNVAGSPQVIYTNSDISYGRPVLDPNHARAFISRYRMDRSFINRFEAQGQTITPTLELAGASGQLLYHPPADRLYAITDDILQVFDGNLTLLGYTPLPGNFTPFTLDPQAQRLYLGNANGTLLIMAANGGQLAPTPPIKSTEYPDLSHLSVAPDGSYFRIFNQQLYRSTDAGQNWHLPGRGLPNYSVSTLAISPNYATDKTLLAGVSARGASGLYRSTDGGDTWQPTGRGLTDLNVNRIAFSPIFANDQTIFLTTIYRGLFRSTDGGQTWLSLAETYTSDPNEAGVSSLAVSPTFDRDGLVLIGARSLLRSTDGGQTWTDTGLPPGQTAFSPNFGRDGLVLSDGRWRSQDGGQSWQPAAAGLAPNQGGRSLFFSPNFTTDQTVYLVLQQNYTPSFLLQRSLDAGRTWQSPQGGLPAGFNLTVATVLPNGNLYLGGRDGQLLTLSPQKLSWSQSRVDPTGLDIQAMAVDSPGAIFIANSIAGVFKSEDEGRSWGDTGFSARAAETDPARLALADDHTLFAATGPVIERSDDHGKSWTHLSGLPLGFKVNTLAVSPNFSTDGVVLTGGNYASNQLLRSADGGQTWQVVFDGQTVEGAAEMSALAFAQDGTAYAWLSYGGLLRSTDGGQTWARVANDRNNEVVQTLAVSPDPLPGHRLYLGALYGGLYVSENDGQSWQDLGKNIPGQRTWSNTLAFGPGNMLLLGTDIGVYRSSDGGRTWSAANQGLPLDPNLNMPQAIRALAFDNQRFYAALTQGGLYVSDDLAETWVSAAKQAVTLPTPVKTIVPPTATPAPQPTPSPVACSTSPLYLADMWAKRVDQLGCPTTAQRLTMAEQPFADGMMFWRSDPKFIYALPANQPYTRYEDTWNDGLPAYLCPELGPAQTPPTPQRGFGKVWCSEPSVRQLLGPAIGQERAFEASLQLFERGLMFQTDQGTVYILENGSNKWERVN